ncbi:MAG: DUF2617 family protein [Planctomycetia bacterium]|nr:DUF2617 family protein [Planctomycetia bacterium]
MLTVRPKVAELVFQLYGRPLHPELFKVCKTRTVRRGQYEARVDITTAGHVVSWRYQGLTLTEVATSAHFPMPEKRRLLSYRLKGERHDQVNCRGGANYQVSFQLEQVDPSVFWGYQQDLFGDVDAEGLMFRFDSSGRIALGALSYIHIESRARSLQVQAFHTFPDDHAIVKSQSRFEVP